MYGLWQRYKAGDPIVGDEKLLAERMAAHPEWTEWWERSDDLGDARMMVDGVSPFGTVVVEALVEGMIIEAGDKQAHRTYRRLRKEGLSHEQARQEIGRAFTGVYWEVESGRVQYHDFERRLQQIWRRIQAGETAEEIFSVHDTDNG
jgi:hypothetical protein